MAFISEKLISRRAQELGKIKIGKLGPERTSSGGKKFRLPQKLPHFKITTRHRGPDGNFVRDDRIHEQIGEEPTELEGILMFETPEENLHAEMVKYDGKRKIWTCDGETARNLKTEKEGSCPRLDDGECSCKPYVRFPIQLWCSPALGYHTFRSTSWETVGNLQTALREIYERFGTCYHAPVRLVLYPAEDTYEDGQQTKTSTSYKVGLVLTMSMEQAADRMVQAKKHMELAKQELRLLSGQVQSDLEDTDQREAGDIEAEFFPPDDAGLQASVGTQSTMDGMKEELGVGDSDEGPVVDADYEIENGADNGAAPAEKKGREATPEELQELENLDHMANERGLLTESEKDLVAEAAATGDGPMVRSWSRALWSRIQESDDEAEPAEETAGAGQGSLLDGEG